MTTVVYEAVEVLFAYRHHLPNDVLRSLQGIYLCASAARFGEFYETWWVEDASLIRDHNTADCEAENDPEQHAATEEDWAAEIAMMD